MKIALDIATDEQGCKSIAADLTFAQPVKVLLFAWLNNDMWWAKSATWSTSYRWSARYHHLADGSRQVIATCGAIVQHCVVPVQCEPDTVEVADVELLRPAVLFQNRSHGVGIIVVPHGAAKTLRNGIWQLKTAFMHPSLKQFEAALLRSRTGHLGNFTAGAWV